MPFKVLTNYMQKQQALNFGEVGRLQLDCFVAFNSVINPGELRAILGDESQNLKTSS